MRNFLNIQRTILPRLNKNYQGIYNYEKLLNLLNKRSIILLTKLNKDSKQKNTNLTYKSKLLKTCASDSYSEKLGTIMVRSP